MRKKFFAMYALAGALVASPVFTSCIDDTESASVTAIRNANAEKIKAATALAQAQAEMEKAKAEAEIAYKKAQTEEVNLRNEEKKIDIEEAKAKAEAALLRAQADIINATKELKDAENGVLNDLADDYTTALREMNRINKLIVNRGADLAKLEAGLISVQAYVKAETTKLNNEIAGYEAAIKALDGVEGVDLTALKAEYEQLYQAYRIAQTKLEELEMQYGNDASKTATAKAMSDYPTYYNNDAEGYPVLKEAAVATNKETLAAALKTAEKDLADEIARIGKDTDKKDTKYSKININATTGVETVTESLTLYAELAGVKETILGAPKAGETAATGAYIILEKLEAAVKAAKDALAANTDDTQTATLEGNVTTAEAKLLAYKTDKSAATDATAVDYDGDTNKDAGFAWAEAQVAAKEQAILTAKDGLVAKENIVATAKENIEKFEAAIATFAGEDFEAYKTALKELKAAEDARDLASAEHMTLFYFLNDYELVEWDDADGDNIIDPDEAQWGWESDEYLFDVKTIVADYEAKIATAKAKLENLEQNISLPTGDGWNSWDYYTEEEVATLIEYVKGEIEALKLELLVAETEAKEAKAALDAYLATDEEGGEAEA